MCVESVLEMLDVCRLLQGDAFDDVVDVEFRVFEFRAQVIYE